jgi:hypothetical protein
MSEKEHEAQSLPILRDYAKAFGLEPDKTLKDARDKYVARRWGFGYRVQGLGLRRTRLSRIRRTSKLLGGGV